MPVFSSKLIQTGKPLDLGGSNTLETYVSKLEPKPVNASKVQKSKSKYSSVQFSSVTQLYLTLCDPMNHCKPDLPVHHQLPEFTQTHVHRVGDAIQPS